MRTEQIAQIVEQDLRPRYEMSRDSIVSFLISKGNEFKDTLSKLHTLKSETEEHKELYKYLFGYWNNETKKRVRGGIYNGLSQEYTKLIEELGRDWKTEEEVANKYFKKFEKIISDTVSGITKDIEKFNPTNIEIGNSEHDFNFILEREEKRQSYTINTIVAGGYVQCVHNRTLTKLHKGVVA